MLRSLLLCVALCCVTTVSSAWAQNGPSSSSATPDAASETAPAVDVTELKFMLGGGIESHSRLVLPQGLVEGEKAPAVLLVHEWWGLNDYALRRATELAQRGYVVLAVDLYGNGQTTERTDQAAQWAGPLYTDRSTWRRRLNAGFDVLSELPMVDPDRIGAVGYCFGGSAVLELAYTGANLQGVVCLHGNPLLPLNGDANRIKASLLVLHGAADPHAPEERVRDWMGVMSNANVDWQLVVYAGAEHAFTNPNADSHNMPGVSYNAAADHRSFEAMLSFLAETTAAE